MNPEPVIDLTQLDKLRQMGGAAFEEQMIDLFCSYVPQKLAEARAAAQAGDWPAVRRAVHPLTSSAGHLGAVAVQRLARQIEEQAAADDVAAIPQRLVELESAYAAAAATLSAQRDR